MNNTIVNGPQPNRSHGLDEAKFSIAPRPRNPTSTHVPRRETASGKATRGRPPLARHEQHCEEPHSGREAGHYACAIREPASVRSAHSSSTEWRAERQRDLKCRYEKEATREDDSHCRTDGLMVLVCLRRIGNDGSRYRFAHSASLNGGYRSVIKSIE